MASKLSKGEILAKVAKKLPDTLSLDNLVQLPFEIASYSLADILAAKTAVSTEQSPINWLAVSRLMVEFASGKPMINPPELAILHDQLYLVGARHRIHSLDALCEKYGLDPDSLILDCRLYRVNSGAEITRLICASNEARSMTRTETALLNISSSTDFVDITDPEYYLEALKNVWYSGNPVETLRAGLYTKAAILSEKTWDSVPLTGETTIDSDHMTTKLTRLVAQDIAEKLLRIIANPKKSNTFGKAILGATKEFDNAVLAIDLIIDSIDEAVGNYCQNSRRATNIARDGVKVIVAEAEMLLRSAFPESWFAPTMPTTDTPKALAPKKGNTAINDAVAAKF